MRDYVRRCEALVVEVGSGVILLRGVGTDIPEEVTTWLHGSDVRVVLDLVTALAMADEGTPDAETVRGFGRISRAEARRLLPTLTWAAIEATSSAEKYEAMMKHGSDDPPTEPFCHVCGHGTRLMLQDRDWPARCADRGHSAFGARENETWEQATERHRREISSWRFRYDMGLIPKLPPLAR